MHADRRTDRTRLIGDFRDLAKTPKLTRFFFVNRTVFEIIEGPALQWRPILSRHTYKRRRESSHKVSDKRQPLKCSNVCTVC
jgi:hypothetical protein